MFAFRGFNTADRLTAPKPLKSKERKENKESTSGVSVLTGGLWQA